MRRRVGAVMLVVIALLAAWAWSIVSAPRTPAQRDTAAAGLLANVQVSASVTGASLRSTLAIADFGGSGGIRLVRVRIVDQLAIRIRIVTGRDVVLAGPPRLCLGWRFGAPDDAGLSDRCWGTPDISDLVASGLPRDPGGSPVLRAGEPLELTIVADRGAVRCDYPPGDWQLEVWLDPLVDGSPAGPHDLPVVGLAVPWAATDRLVLDTNARYCGLANGPFEEQGEPAIQP